MSVTVSVAVLLWLQHLRLLARDLEVVLELAFVRDLEDDLAVRRAVFVESDELELLGGDLHGRGGRARARERNDDEQHGCGGRGNATGMETVRFI